MNFVWCSLLVQSLVPVTPVQPDTSMIQPGEVVRGANFRVMIPSASSATPTLRRLGCSFHPCYRRIIVIEDGHHHYYYDHRTTDWAVSFSVVLERLRTASLSMHMTQFAAERERERERG